MEISISTENEDKLLAILKLLDKNELIDIAYEVRPDGSKIENKELIERLKKREYEFILESSSEKGKGSFRLKYLIEHSKKIPFYFDENEICEISKALTRALVNEKITYDLFISRIRHIIKYVTLHKISLSDFVKNTLDAHKDSILKDFGIYEDRYDEIKYIYGIHRVLFNNQHQSGWVNYITFLDAYSMTKRFLEKYPLAARFSCWDTMDFDSLEALNAYRKEVANYHSSTRKELKELLESLVRKAKDGHDFVLHSVKFPENDNDCIISIMMKCSGEARKEIDFKVKDLPMEKAALIEYLKKRFS